MPSCPPPPPLRLTGVSFAMASFVAPLAASEFFLIGVLDGAARAAAAIPSPPFCPQSVGNIHHGQRSPLRRVIGLRNEANTAFPPMLWQLACVGKVKQTHKRSKRIVT